MWQILGRERLFATPAPILDQPQKFILNRVKINSKYFTIKEFLSLDLNDNYLSLFHVNIVSLKKYIDDLHNLLNIIKLQTQVIRICQHKSKKGFYLNGSLPGYTSEFQSATSTHEGVRFFINDNLCYKVRNDLIECSIFKRNFNS